MGVPVKLDAFLIGNSADLSDYNELGPGYQFCSVVRQRDPSNTPVITPGTQIIVFNQILGLSKRAYHDICSLNKHTKNFLAEFIEIVNIATDYSQ